MNIHRNARLTLIGPGGVDTVCDYRRIYPGSARLRQLGGNRECVDVTRLDKFRRR